MKVTVSKLCPKCRKKVLRDTAAEMRKYRAGKKLVDSITATNPLKVETLK